MPAHDNYDEEPVLYCTRCYSLNIIYEGTIDSDCCRECGCSDVESAPIERWEQMYAARYGHPFVVRSSDPKKSLIYGMTLQELKNLVFDCSEWKSIVKALYPGFPSRYGKADSLLLFFDKICKDGRVNDLKACLYRFKKQNRLGVQRKTKQLRWRQVLLKVRIAESSAMSS